MEPAALLAELLALADDVPDFATFTPTSRLHHAWLGKVQALVRQYSETEGRSVSLQMGFIGLEISRDSSVSAILGALHRAIANIEATLPQGRDHAFGPGAVYDFFKTLRDLLNSATQTIFIIDPFLDDEIFDTYLSPVFKSVMVRLLAGKHSASLKPALTKFMAQTRINVEVRSSRIIHDRVLFIDGRSCWVLGQSIKDAAKAKPTYLAPLDTKTGQSKKAAYEGIWSSATPI
jgi:hypothetical protein